MAPEINNDTYKFFVKNSPWLKELPNGTQIIKTEPRKPDGTMQWYKRADGKRLFPYKGEEDGKFCLLLSEVKSVKI